VLLLLLLVVVVVVEAWCSCALLNHFCICNQCCAHTASLKNGTVKNDRK
jgi:hypothetical protein